MIIRKAPPRQLALDEPIRHAEGHKRPVTRRDFLAQGFAAGLGTVVAPTVFGLFANPRAAMAALSPDLEALRSTCGIEVLGERDEDGFPLLVVVDLGVLIVER